MSGLSIHLVGGFRVTIDGEEVPAAAWRGERSRSLLQYLATLPSGRATREELMEALWGHLPIEQARGSLHVTINRLRRALSSAAADRAGEQFVVATATGYQLAPGSWVDVTALHQLLEQVRTLPLSERAPLLLEQPDFQWVTLPELSVDQPFSDWAVAVRERVRADFVSLQILRADLLQSQGGLHAALDLLVGLLESEPVLEAVTRQAMLIAHNLGNQVMALSLFDRCRRALAEELGVTPMPETLALHTRILGPAELPATAVQDLQPANLPVPLSSFVGRTRELAELGEALRTARLITITGVGGAGKTRLALQAAAAEAFPHGIWFVELAPVTTGAHVGVAVLEALGLKDQVQATPLERLSAFLRHKQLLIVLDNCEHLLDASAELANGLLRACPQVKVLATSREPLGVDGEHLFPITGLPLPEADADEQALDACESSRLFLERVRAANPAGLRAEVNPAVIARICRRLDGLPLALELAAGRVRALTIEQVADRLDDRFRLLMSSNRTTESRHQSLLATIDWSYGQLTEPEQILLRRLSIFAGGATLPMVEAVCAGDGVEPSAVLDLLSHLVDRSLLLANRQGAEARYTMLESIRAYATERLQQAGEAVLLSDRHLAYFAQMVVEGAPASLTAGQGVWFDRLRAELDNIRAALTWSLTAESVSDGLIMVTYLYWFWDARGHVREGREITAKLLARPDAPSTGPLWPRALVSAASLAFSQLDCAETLRLGHQALALMRQSEDSIFMIPCLFVLGWAYLRSGEPEEAERYFHEAIEVAGFPALVFSANQGLGILYAERGEFDRAEAALVEALAGAEMMGNPRGIATTLAHQGALALARAQHDQALELLVKAVIQLAEQGDLCGVSIPLGPLARTLQQMGRLPQAARLFGALEGLKERTGTAMVGSDLAAFQESLDATRGALAEGFESAYMSGKRMDQGALLSVVGSLVSGG